MSARGLKTNILIDLVLLLSASMLMINIVMVNVAGKDLLRAEIDKGFIFIEALAINLRPVLSRSDTTPDFDSTGIWLMMNRAGVSAVMAVEQSGRMIAFEGYDQQNANLLKVMVQRSIETGKPNIDFQGAAWGVLWKGSKNILVSSPFSFNGQAIGAAGVVLPLEDMYRIQLKGQKIFYVYFLINLVILTYLGFYRLHKVLVRPLLRLVSRTESFSDEDEFYFGLEKDGNEFNKLSKSLNQMLSRINRDKEQLQATIISLEEANRDLKKAQKETIRAEKLASVGRLSAGIAHEIGNPIGIVLGYFDLLKQKKIGDEQKKDFIRRAEGEVNRINTIIRQLLDFSRHSDEALGPLSVHKLIDDLQKLVAVQPLMADIDLKLLLAAEHDEIIADKDQLRQVLLNLLINASDAIASQDSIDGGKVTIKTENVSRPKTAKRGGGEQLKISVIDNGPGIEQDKLSDIFDPFYTTKDPGKGTGLGLSICFTIIEGFGGRITAENNPDRGTIISIYLPLMKSSNECEPGKLYE
ncbi:MAG: hypothetical protein KKB30_07980 [Proteobacteria bacterium]|nr:hypothetical protein [Pseudomonadota bacterium]MBU1714757.1 hypothetical protein [Pseudomonadota bacterium]